MSDTKISEVAVDVAAFAVPGAVPTLEHAKEVVRRVVALYLKHSQPAKLAEQQGLELPPLPASRGFIQWHSPQAINQAHGFTATQMQDYARAAFAATGKQQPSTFDGGGEYYADQHGDGAWATYLRNGKGWVYNFGQGDDAEIRAKSVARELNRQVSSITARTQVGEVQGSND